MAIDIWKDEPFMREPDDCSFDPVYAERPDDHVVGAPEPEKKVAAQQVLEDKESALIERIKQGRRSEA